MASSIWNAPTPDPNYDENQKARVAWFEKIKPEAHWKGPIDCWIAARDFDDCAEAAIFFAGSILEVAERRGGRVRVVAAGYFAAVGA